jgi:hypothetical protein
MQRIGGDNYLTQNIQSIFEHNIKLLGDMDKAVYYFREQQYDIALGLIANSIDEIKLSMEAIIMEREYFHLVKMESMLEMLNGILAAKKNKDFILLADLLELQLINFLIGVQELIMRKEEILFDEEKYQENIKALIENSVDLSEDLLKPINTAKLLESGYSIEFTYCGHMTLAAENEGMRFYFHTNSKTQTEAFLLARHWYREDKRRYLIYGFGMGYHIAELSVLAPHADIIIYEADINVIQLACAFTNVRKLLAGGKIKLVYDPEFILLKNKLTMRREDEQFCIHYPSFMNIHNQAGKEVIENELPWINLINAC